MLDFEPMVLVRQIIFAVIFFIPTLAHADAYMELRISLFPAGSFVAKSTRVTGIAELSGHNVTAKNIKVDTKSFDSGIELRNKHIRQRFESDQYPIAMLIEAQGKNGTGTAKIQVKNKTKTVDGTYEIVDDKNLEATFKVKASDFDIKDVSYMKVGMEDELEVFVRVPLVKASVKSKGGKAK